MSDDNGKSLFHIPQIAWVTIGTFVLAMASWSGIIWTTVGGHVSWAIGTVLCAVSIYIAFTPLHDAVHQSISKYKWINEVIGRICGWSLLATFAPFRYVHLEHHKHTNDVDKDPDFWSGRGPWFLLPIRWCTQDLHYWYLFAKHRDRHTKAEVVEVVLTIGIQIGIVVFAGMNGYLKHVLLLWIVPAKMAVAFLAFSFDYLPHRPYKISAKENRFRATCVRPAPLLTPILMYQNYHLVHHLYPAVPFYRYSRVWFAQREELLQKGADVRHFLKRNTAQDIHVAGAMK